MGTVIVALLFVFVGSLIWADLTNNDDVIGIGCLAFIAAAILFVLWMETM